MNPQLYGSALISREKTLLIPQRQKRRKSNGVTWQSFHFISIDEPYFDFQKHVVYPSFFVSRKPLSANGGWRYERTPYGVHFVVFPIYMPLVNENLDFKITNIRSRFFTKKGHKFVFLCKNVLKFLYETRQKNLSRFSWKRLNFIKHGEIAHKRSSSHKK